MTDKLKEYADKLYKPNDKHLGPIAVSTHKQISFIEGLKLGAEFAEWVSDNGWILCIDKKQWSNYEKSDIGEFATTPELIDIFLTEKMKKHEKYPLFL